MYSNNKYLLQVVNISQCGVMEVERITQLTDRLIEQCLKIYPLSQRCLVKTVLTNLNAQKQLENDTAQTD